MYKFTKLPLNKFINFFKKELFLMRLRGIIGIVGTRFALDHSRVGFARKWTRTISFVESGVERLSHVYSAVVLLSCSCMI